MPAISIVVVNHNRKQMLEECLDSLLEQRFRDFEIIVVDNGSEDGSIDHVAHKFGARVHCVRSEKNLGFAGGMNLGISYAKGDWIATINNDAVADAGWLEELFIAGSRNPNSMLAPKILDYAHRGIIDSAGGLLIFPDGVSRGAARLERDQGNFAEPRPILVPTCCAAMYPRGVFEDVGCFDHRFFAYFEDFDLGFRARMAGWNATYVPLARVYHRYSQTMGAYSTFKAFHIERNRIWIAIKLFPLEYLLALPYHTLRRYAFQLVAAISDKGSTGKMARQSSFPRVFATLIHAYLSALGGLPYALAARKRIWAGRRIPKRKVLQLLNEFTLPVRELAFKD